jgi:hypothetical protein
MMIRSYLSIQAALSPEARSLSRRALNVESTAPESGYAVSVVRISLMILTHLFDYGGMSRLLEALMKLNTEELMLLRFAEPFRRQRRRPRGDGAQRARCCGKRSGLVV